MMLPAPVTRSGAQASSQNIREGRSAPLAAAISRGPAPSPILALAGLLCGHVHSARFWKGELANASEVTESLSQSEDGPLDPHPPAVARDGRLGRIPSQASVLVKPTGR